jgi:hypothetical protein
LTWLVIGLVTSITALWQEQVHTRIRERDRYLKKQPMELSIFLPVDAMSAIAGNGVVLIVALAWTRVISMTLL